MEPAAQDESWGGDKPYCVYIDGVAYWAIPPNVNDDAQVGPGGMYNVASHWDPGDWGHPDGVLRPGDYLGDASHASTSVLPDQRGRTSTDLVFTLPATAAAGFYGVALFDTETSADASKWTLLATCEQAKGCLNQNNRMEPSAF
ncbi:hypothetical protein KNO15_03395 [Leifsonia shinshuensis]|uniref:hypothetical protein n=1 Tax=Leifsonia shinshuensis TaxID=150026 RepID=UPI001F504E89|nr:hypothetical protein [Leifsonia shinshuensis]MCI0155739.1 hypothetical protein [Leifsonia shinshuensis]